MVLGGVLLIMLLPFMDMFMLFTLALVPGILPIIYSYLYHRNKGRVKQKTKESLLFVQVVVIIMNECPLAMQSSAAFRTENEGKGKAIT